MSEATVTALPSKPTAVPLHRCDACGQVCASANGVLIHKARAHAPRPAKTAPPPTAKVTKTDRPPAASTMGAEHVTDQNLLSVLAVAYHELCGADVATCIESAAALIQAIADNGWVVTTR